ncbi:hypothetical protein DW709_14905 [Coprococcus sp. AM27-12LB]|nr:hypothetical protein DW709_14905 [Coprococcus sp. AM27-12LB]
MWIVWNRKANTKKFGWKEVKVKRKVILSITFFISLLPMLMNQYGGCKEVQEISGIRCPLFQIIRINQSLLATKKAVKYF